MRAAILVFWLAGGAVMNSFEPGAGPGVDGAERSLFALAGNYRALLADWFWLETNLAWERHDARETRRLIDLTLAADPASRYYWLNSARMLAYDFPEWVKESDLEAPAVVQRRRAEIAAEEALELLQRAGRRNRSCAALEIEMANVCLYALEDRTRAAGHYRRAANLPDAPAYAARIAARLEEEGR